MRLCSAVTAARGKDTTFGGWMASKIRVEHPSEQVLKDHGVSDWPIWTKEPSTFDWHYAAAETCYFLTGEVVVSAGGDEVRMGAGDFVMFPKGLKCTWHVKQAVRKHYQFG